MPMIAPHPTPEPMDNLVGADRRFAERFPSDQNTSCHAATTAGANSIPACVKDVSRTGIGLVLGRRFEPGTLLAIQLEEPAEDCSGSLLARVVRIVPQENGEWVLGCIFLSELGTEELDVFRSERVSPAEPERRAWVRLSCDARTLCRSDSAQPPTSWCAKVVDVSAGGVGLLAPHAPEEGARLRIGLPALDGRPARLVMARVVRQRVQADGQWLLGCEIEQEL